MAWERSQRLEIQLLGTIYIPALRKVPHHQKGPTLYSAVINTSHPPNITGGSWTQGSTLCHRRS